MRQEPPRIQKTTISGDTLIAEFAEGFSAKLSPNAFIIDDPENDTIFRFRPKGAISRSPSYSPEFYQSIWQQTVSSLKV